MLAGLSAAAALVVVTSGPAQAVEGDGEPVKRELKVLTWNICGENLVLRGSAPGYCPHRPDVEGKAKKVAELATTHKADVIMLQEVCGYQGDVNAMAVRKAPREPGDTSPFPGLNSKSHMAYLQQQLPGWTFAHAPGLRSTDKESYCRNSTSPGYGEIGGERGVLIAVKGALQDVRRIETLPGDPAGNSQQAVCGRLTGWPDLLCTAHLSASSNSDQAKQVAELKKQLGGDSWAPDVVIGGDLNGSLADPDLAGLTGALDACETDKHTAQTWAPTASAPSTWSLDHFFANKLNAGTRWLGSSCEVDHTALDRTHNLAGTQPDGWSDHAPVIATLRQAPAPGAPVPGDMTGDGKPDLVAVDSDGALRLYAGRGDGSITTPPQKIGMGGWTGASVAHRGDWNGDGREDLLARVGSELRVYPNTGAGFLGSPVRVASGLPTNATVAGVGDLTLDGIPDAVVSNSGKLYRYNGKRSPEPAVEAPAEIGSGGWGVMDISGAGDANRDGLPDLLARQRSGTDEGKVWLYPGRAGGGFGVRTQYGYGYTTDIRPLIAGAADADGNGIADMWATTSDGTGRLLFYKGATNGSGDPVDGPAEEVGATSWHTAIKSIS